MGSYRVVARCAYVTNGAAVVHTRPGAVVELDEATAAQLGDVVRLVGEGSKPKRRREPKIRVEVGDGKADETPISDVAPPEAPPAEDNAGDGQ